MCDSEDWRDACPTSAHAPALSLRPSRNRVSQELLGLLRLFLAGNLLGLILDSGLIKLGKIRVGNRPDAPVRQGKKIESVWLIIESCYIGKQRTANP